MRTIINLIRMARDLRNTAQLVERVCKLERAIDAIAYTIDRLDERDADLRARQDEFAKV